MVFDNKAFKPAGGELTPVHKHNVRRRKLESNASETARIASIVQKGVSTGRSSYVEMRALARQTGQNIRSRLHAITVSAKDERTSELLKSMKLEAADGYTDVLTPNGTIRQRELDGLLAIDSEIVTCLVIIELQLKEGIALDAIKTLEELAKERKKFVDDLRV